MSQSSSAIPGSIYQHYKGNLYQIVVTATDVEKNEDLVVYRSTENRYKIWARPVSMFFGTLSSGSPRFRFCSELSLSSKFDKAIFKAIHTETEKEVLIYRSVVNSDLVLAQSISIVWHDIVLKSQLVFNNCESGLGDK